MLTSSLSSSPSFIPRKQLPGERLLRTAPALSFPTDVPLLVEQIRVDSDKSLCAVPRLQHHLLGVVLEGASEAQYRLRARAEVQTASLSTGTTFLIRSNADGEWGWSAKSCVFMFIYVPPTLSHRVGSAHGVTPSNGTLRTQFVGHDQLQYFLARSLEQVLNASDDSSSVDTLAQSVVRTMVLRIVDGQETAPALLDGSTGPLCAPARRRLQKYIQAHLDSDLYVSDLAAQVDLSSSHFNRLFRETVGMTPYRYVLHERIRRAQHLLATTDDSIANIALQVGFANQSHLTRRFQAIMRTTPGAYRRAVAQNGQVDGPEADGRAG